MSATHPGSPWAAQEPEPSEEDVTGLVDADVDAAQNLGAGERPPGLRARLRARLRAAGRALVSSREQLDAQDVRRERFAGTTPIARAHARTRVTVGGMLASVTYPPADGAPILRARVFDGTGTLELVFLGRRRVPGIEPGSRLRATGTPTDEGRGLVLYNPALELVSVPSETP